MTTVLGHLLMIPWNGLPTWARIPAECYPSWYALLQKEFPGARVFDLTELPDMDRPLSEPIARYRDEGPVAPFVAATDRTPAGQARKP